MPANVPIYERSNEFAPKLMSESALSCPHRETCMSASRCKGTCWFAKGDFDLGKPAVDPELIDMLRQFANRWREENGCTWREVARILDAPATTVFEIAKGRRTRISDEIASRMTRAMGRFVSSRIAQAPSRRNLVELER